MDHTGAERADATGSDVTRRDADRADIPRTDVARTDADRMDADRMDADRMDADRTPAYERGGRMRIPRSRGAVSGFLLLLLGLWGALIPFVGPYVHFGYDPDTPWMWTTARGWLEVLPGAVTVLGGLLLLFSANRATALLGGWLATVAGAWFVIGRLFATPLGLGDIGGPVAATQPGRIAVELTFFTGLGAVILALGGMALGRLSVRSVRDIRYAHPSVDSYRAGEPVDRQPIAHERAAMRARPASATR